MHQDDIKGLAAKNPINNQTMIEEKKKVKQEKEGDSANTNNKSGDDTNDSNPRDKILATRIDCNKI
jgi:hypothetical protein